MPLSTLLPPGAPVHDLELFHLLRGRRLSAQIRVLAVIGAHRFDELPLVNKVFPGLRAIYVFEPLPGPLAVLHTRAQADRRIRVFPVAVSAEDGTAQFHVTSNDGESSSLLPMGSHRELFPQVVVQHSITVTTRRLASVLAEHGLAPPDALIIDVQGAEYQVLQSLPAALLQQVRLIYTEVSTEPVYQGSRPLADVAQLLAPQFVNLGFAALQPDLPMHGNAVFAAAGDVPAALAFTPLGALRRGFHRWRRRLRPAREPAR
ncbi:MAG: FkbM family methyltransferase [Rubrivivax sp.]|nr:FkbM family methyltransferase [Rubrivivax sp.]